MFDIGNHASWHIEKYKQSRFWAIREGGPNGKLVCLCVYRKGAREVVRRLDGGSEKDTERSEHKGIGPSVHAKGAVA